MVIRANKFTPEVLLSAPRRSAGIANSAGSLVAYTINTYSFDEHKKSSTFEILAVETSRTYVLAEDKDISDPNWLSDNELVYLQATTEGKTELKRVKLSHSSSPEVTVLAHNTVGSIDAAASNLKVKRLDADSFAVIVSTEVIRSGTNKTLRSSGRLYDHLFVRHWDRYEDRSRNTLQYGLLQADISGKHTLSPLIDALQHTSLECPIRPFGGTDCFDISADRIIYTAKDPDLDPALNTKVNVYLQTIQSWDRAPSKGPELLDMSSWEGAKSNPVFSPDGKKAAFLAMRKNGYEADQNRIFVLLDVQVLETSSMQPLNILDAGTFWDRSPSSLDWTEDGETLLTTAEDHGFVKLFSLPVGVGGIVKPSMITISGSISHVSPLTRQRALLSGSSLIDNSLFVMVDLLNHSAPTNELWLKSNSSHGNRFGLSSKQISSIWTPASNPEVNKEIHSWVVKPSTFEKGKRYPVAYLIHGGPQGSWADSWSTRWNPAVFAEQGYIVVTPNPTGSTGYGQAFTDAIQHNWGGDPYHDIVNVFEWVGENLPEADNDRAVALGASYGGYMMNWIQGNDLGRKFKALVCHDGIFACSNMLATEELYFAFHDIGTPSFYDPKKSNDLKEHAKFKLATFSSWQKWDPSQHLDRWDTPELVIHNSKDYRIPISEGLAAFNVLQARGIKSQFLTFPDENHWVLKPENSLVWHTTVLNWINKYVGLPPYSTVMPDNEAFFGGIKIEQGDLGAEMPIQGKPET